jgi:Raf kinase inhibitor-like YbhB/YbcL family protein
VKYVILLIIALGIAFLLLNPVLTARRGSGPDIMPTTTKIMIANFALTSSAFEHNGLIPSKYTCDGDRAINPPLEFSGVPEGAKSLVLIMDDHDVPKELRSDGVYDHWVIFNIPADTKKIIEGGSNPGVHGANSSGASAYTGPCPPPQYEPREHRYVFKLYALSAILLLPAGATKKDVLDALIPVKLAETELIGRYSRK